MGDTSKVNTASTRIPESDLPKRYHRIKLILSLVSTALEWIYLLLLVLTPLSAAFVRFTDLSGNAYLHFLLFGLIAGVPLQIISLPLSFISDYIVEHHYILSNQALGGWIWERIKGMLVGGVIGIPLAVLFYFCLRTFGAGWWLPVGIVLFLFSVVLGRLAPILIFPLFYKFETLAADDPLEDSIKTLCDSVGMTVKGVYRFNLSKTTKKANAAFTGLGRAKRILLADTLLDEFSQDEIAAVVAHELGHFRLKHIWKGIAFGMVLTLLGLFAVARFHAVIADGQVAALVYLPWLVLFLSLYSFVTGPISNVYSRRHEYAADRFAVTLIGGGITLASSLERLGELNLADRNPHPVVEFLFHSHPSLARRLAALERVRLSE
jgi:STE24 endopeptidase